MIARSYIHSNLELIDRKFRSAKSSTEALLLSKLAILELCGWIEESMDDIILRCSVRHLKESNNRKYCETDVVKKTFGFEYARHFRLMMTRLLGLIAVERIEAKVDPTKKATMLAALAALRMQRNTEAHTYLKGTTRTINAPSVTLAQLTPLYEGLFEFDRVIRKKVWK